MTITAELYLWIVLMFLIGQAVCFFAIDVPTLRELYKKSNETFSLAKWWEHDWNIFITVQLIGITLLIGLPEILHWKPTWIEKIRWGSWGLGFIGSGIATRLSKYRKAIFKVVDKKTNIADGKP